MSERPENATGASGRAPVQGKNRNGRHDDEPLLPDRQLEGDSPAFTEFLTAARKLNYSESQLASLLRLKSQQRLLLEEFAARPMVEGATVDTEVRP